MRRRLSRFLSLSLFLVSRNKKVGDTYYKTLKSNHSISRLLNVKKRTSVVRRRSAGIPSPSASPSVTDDDVMVALVPFNSSSSSLSLSLSSLFSPSVTKKIRKKNHHHDSAVLLHHDRSREAETEIKKSL